MENVSFLKPSRNGTRIRSRKSCYKGIFAGILTHRHRQHITWEVHDRTIRRLLNALMQQHTLEDYSLATIMYLAEAIVNKRPLATVSVDHTFPEPLTPNELFFLRVLTLPPGKFAKEDTYGRRRWRKVQYLADVCWGR